MGTDWRTDRANFSHVTQKLGQISKIRPDQIYILRTSLTICGQLPAPIVNGREDSFWKWKYFQLWRARYLDLGSGHTAYCCASLIDLGLHAKFHWNWKKNFLWTDGQTYARRHRRTFEIGLIRSTLLKSRPKKWSVYTYIFMYTVRTCACTLFLSFTVLHLCLCRGNETGQWMFVFKMTISSLIDSCQWISNWPRIRRASCISFGMTVTRFAWIAQRLESSNRWTRYASAA